ncbi:MAG: hemolysin family protein, partial [Coriobacteriaceae bacterium]|nr:hemolysin family protein [Coriobacteriaceae bacterium]
MSTTASIIVIVALILLNGLFAASEEAILRARRALLEKEAEEGNRQSKRAERLVSASDKVLPAIQASVVLVGFCVAAIAALNLSPPLSAWFEAFNLDWLTAVAPILAPIIVVLATAYLYLVFGELFPKAIALADVERAAKSVAAPLSLVRTLMLPLTAVALASAHVLARIFRVEGNNTRLGVSEEEIKNIVTDNPELLDDEKRMIHEIIDLGDMTVREVMTPRVDMILAQDSETVRQVIERMRGTGYSRLPIFHENHDSIVGIAHFKDLVGPLMEGKEDDPVAKYMFEAFFVPETKDMYPLLSEMQTNRQQMAIVVDEYGGTDGLITIEDIIEEIVGEIVDETDSDDSYIIQLSDDEWLVDGRYPCEDALELGLPVKISDDYETVAGWLMDEAGIVLQVGDEFEVDGFFFKIQAMRRRRISKIRVKRLLADERRENAPTSAKAGEPKGK